MSDSGDTKKKSELKEADIETGPAISRRAALLTIGTTAIGGAAAVSSTLTGCVVAQPRPTYYQQPQQGTVYVQQQPQQVYVQGQPQQQVYVQPQTGYQRAYSGMTDGDQGQWADPAGYGRGSYRGVQTGITDSDNGTGGIQDPAGQGRGHHGAPGWQSGLTDSDGGAYADPAGNGRGRYSGQTGVTDSDGGAYADPAGRGRGRWR